MKLWKDAAEAVYITNMRMMWTTGVCARIRMSMVSTPCSGTAATAGRVVLHGKMKTRKERRKREYGAINT